MRESIVVFCVRGIGHLNPLLPLIEGLAARGCTVHVLTGAEYRGLIERCGGRFVDLFARYPVEAADPSSRPIPSRYVTFAGVYADRLRTDVAALEPALIVYDLFSVVAPVVARGLGVPYVAVCTNHAPVPARSIAALRDDPRVDTSAECHAAVKRLREVYGIASASPFSYFDSLSPFLNVYVEPEEFLVASDRAALEPVAFFGGIAPGLHPPGGANVFEGGRAARRILVSFGTLIWRYYAAQALAALTALADAFADRDVDAVVTLGGHDLAPEARAGLERRKLRVSNFADQWEALRTADVFVTHHGVNSTHEAIFHQVPMLSYPFLGDQPLLARHCRDLGLAVPLAEETMAPLTPASVRAALSRLDADAEGFRTRLATARSWELRTIADRGAVIDRILALAP